MISPEPPRASSESRAAIRPPPATRHVSNDEPTPTDSTPPSSSVFFEPPPLVPTVGTTSPSPQKGPRDESPRHPRGGRFLRDPLLSADASRSPSQSPFRLPMPTISPAQLSFSALQYHPIPTIVVNNLKTVVLANEAMGRLLGITSEDADDAEEMTACDHLRGQTLSQVGIDMLQEGKPVWITWEVFLDAVAAEMAPQAAFDAQQHQGQPGGGDATPTIGSLPDRRQRRESVLRTNQDCAVEVVISRKDLSRSTFDSRLKTKESEYQIFAKMLVTLWEVEDRQTYFTLTFTHTQSAPTSQPPTKKYIARPSILEAAEKRSISHSTPSSVASSRDSGSPSLHSPGIITMSSSPFPPMGPPSAASQPTTPSILQKMMLLKDALLDNTQVPILAMWRDGTVSLTNKAARTLFAKGVDQDAPKEGYDMLPNWELWTDDFSRALDISEYPISILLRTGQPFEGKRVGVYDANGKKIVLDIVGEAICEPVTGEFLAGVITGRDVTSITQEIEEIKERDEERFRLICDTMPQLVWTADTDGKFDFFNTRWYSFTGLSPQQSLGHNWTNAIHPDDVAVVKAKWHHSLRTGDQFDAETRGRNKEGKWTWLLARALAVRNKETGEIEKWFGE